VTTILCYGPDKDDLTGSLLHAMGEAMQLKVGYNRELLAAPLILSKNVTNSWIKHVWISTQEAAITISTDFLEIPPQRHGDTEIMRPFIQTGWKQLELQTLNQCQIFLKFFLLLSDIQVLALHPNSGIGPIQQSLPTYGHAVSHLLWFLGCYGARHYLHPCT